MTRSKDLLAEMVSCAADENPVHSVRVWLSSLAWDGVSRLPLLLPRALGTTDTDLPQAYGVAFLVGAVARVMKPGCKLDTMLVLVLVPRSSTGRASVAPSSRGLSVACQNLAGQALRSAHGPEMRASRANIHNALATVHATRGQLAAATSDWETRNLRTQTVRRDLPRVATGLSPRETVRGNPTDAGDAKPLISIAWNRIRRVSVPSARVVAGRSGWLQVCRGPRWRDRFGLCLHAGMVARPLVADGVRQRPGGEVAGGAAGPGCRPHRDCTFNPSRRDRKTAVLGCPRPVQVLVASMGPGPGGPGEGGERWEPLPTTHPLQSGLQVGGASWAGEAGQLSRPPPRWRGSQTWRGPAPPRVRTSRLRCGSRRPGHGGPPPWHLENTLSHPVERHPLTGTFLDQAPDGVDQLIGQGGKQQGDLVLGHPGLPLPMGSAVPVPLDAGELRRDDALELADAGFCGAVGVRRGHRLGRTVYLGHRHGQVEWPSVRTCGSVGESNSPLWGSTGWL